MSALFKISLVVLVAVVLSACAASGSVDRIKDSIQDKELLALEKAVSFLDEKKSVLIETIRLEYERRVISLAAQRARDDIQMQRLKALTEQ